MIRIKNNQQNRVKHQIEVQTHQIESVFSRHQLSARVLGGQVQSYSINFDIQAQLLSGWERLRGLKDDLVSALNVTDVKLVRENGGLKLQVVRPYEAPVPLLRLLERLPDIGSNTAVLGLAENEQPVLLNFSDEDVSHVLLSGNAKAGKSVLLRSMIASLAIKNRQSQMQMLVIDGMKKNTDSELQSDSVLRSLNWLPHMLADVIQNGKDSIQALQFLVDEMQYRQEGSVSEPIIVLFIDHVVSLMESDGGAIQSAIRRLVQHGAGVGIHLVLSTRQPESAVLDELLKAHLPTRIVGQVASAEKARAASDINGSGAEGLLGEGDFLAMVGGQTTRFQAAFLGDYDLHLSIKSLKKKHKSILLARPFTPRPQLKQEKKAAAPAPFSIIDGNATFDDLLGDLE